MLEWLKTQKVPKISHATKPWATSPEVPNTTIPGIPVYLDPRYWRIPHIPISKISTQTRKTTTTKPQLTTPTWDARVKLAKVQSRQPKRQRQDVKPSINGTNSRVSKKQEAFNPDRHCVMCAAWHKVNQGIMDKSALPHRPHHNRCPKKKPDKRALNKTAILNDITGTTC